jgi:AraC-like DNA-binding protein
MPLTVFARPGRCAHCQQWLGLDAAGACRENIESASTVIEPAFRQATSIGELIRLGPTVDEMSIHRVWIDNLKACIATVTNGNQDAFAKVCRTSRSSLAASVKGCALPSLGTMLRISERLGIPLTSFLEADPERAAACWQAAKWNVSGAGSIVTFRSREKVKSVLQKAALQQFPPTLSEIARCLGYKGTERLYQVDRKLCKRIAANHRRSGQSHSWRKKGAKPKCEPADLQRMLEQSLALDEPVSAHHIAARVGYANDGYLQRRFPDLCRAIRQKIASNRIKRHAEMERVLVEALNEEFPPTLNALRVRLGYSSSESLQLHFPNLCKRLLARRQEARAKWVADIAQKINTMLVETPAVSLSTVSLRLGLSTNHLKDLCPTECAALASRYVRWRSEASGDRKTRLTIHIRNVVEQLHAAGHHATIKRVSALLPSNALREWHTLTSAIKAARALIEA